MDSFLEDNTIRALIGSAIIIGAMICTVCCLYKYALCKEEEDKRRMSSNPTRVISVKPDERIYIQVKK
jgi:hypothetical protein